MVSLGLYPLEAAVTPGLLIAWFSAFHSHPLLSVSCLALITTKQGSQQPSLG